MVCFGTWIPAFRRNLLLHSLLSAKMEAADSFETYKSVYVTTCRHNSEDHGLESSVSVRNVGLASAATQPTQVSVDAPVALGSAASEQ
jgi:hypothetical protein